MAALIGKLLFTGVAMLFVLFGLGIIKFGRMITAPVRAMEAEEPTAVADLEPGEPAEVHGTVRPAEEGTFETPLYREDAVEVTTKVQRSGDGGDPTRGWYTYHEERASVPFLVADDTGDVRVQPPEDSRPTVPVDWERFGAGADGDLSAAARDYLSGIDAADLDAGIDVGPLSLGARQRCGEGAVNPGDDVYVYGHVVETDNGWGDTTLTITGKDDAPFVYSTVEPDTVKETTSKLGYVVIAFGVIWTIATFLGGIMPWLVE